jgi:3-hydroxybutyryl-CoA dehydrogenase
LTDQSTKGGNLAHQLGIVGSGAIARGLARVAAEHHEVVVWARSEQSAERAAEKVADARVVTDLDELTGCDIVVEAVTEDADVKADLLAEIGAAAPDADLATTTSSLSIAELGRRSGHAERFFGLHVFNPVTRMELVELCIPEGVRDGLAERATAWCNALDKIAVEVPDSAGFVVNRLLFPYLFDAVRLMESSGLSAAAVDDCMRLGAGHPMGPLKLLDFIGLDVAKAIGETLHAESGDDSHRPPPAINKMVGAGKLGKKAGEGFYTY